MTEPTLHPLWKWTPGAAPLAATDELAVEEPLEIRVNRRPVSVTMRTPGPAGQDAELAAGFLFTEALIANRAAVAEFSTRPGVVDVHLAHGVSIDLGRLTRHVFASSSCGVCGKASIEAIEAHFPPLPAPGVAASQFPAALFANLPERLRTAQPTFARTGGLHAAALFDAAGRLLIAREDVGRHNALDKVIGRAFLDGLLPLDRHVVLLSGRVSFELVQKALAARIPVLAAVSAPSSLAVEFADSSGLTLIGFLRDGRMNVYSHPERLAGWTI
ncbi:MAG TPA: formate dehydrogenase accessory sulfurtransferase FdhD [Planctomycetota bacterium]|nr:formate dehydrogenase accessory sulfurtransferase FdhD [Planctomycetota bacterium]